MNLSHVAKQSNLKKEKKKLLFAMQISINLSLNPINFWKLTESPDFTSYIHLALAHTAKIKLLETKVFSVMNLSHLAKQTDFNKTRNFFFFC